MLGVALLALLCCIAPHAGAIQPTNSSSSGVYGRSGGESFSQYENQKEGSITALKVRATRQYIVGIQVRYEEKWSKYVGGSSGDLKEMSMQSGESIIQAKGKYNNYVSQLDFITDKGRHFTFGTGSGTSFNATPLYPGTVLRYLSGSSSSAINAIGFHWDIPAIAPAAESEGAEQQRPAV